MKNFELATGDNNVISSLASFFRALLENNIVDSLLVPREVKPGGAVITSLVKDPGELENANPLAPVAMSNAASSVSKLTVNSPGEKIGVVLRACEIRALVELVKLQQASLDDLLIIGVDCAGTFEPGDYFELVRNPDWNLEAWLKKAAGDEVKAGDKDIRQACRMCSNTDPGYAQINIGWIGLTPSDKLLVRAADEPAAQLEQAGFKEMKEDAEKTRQEKLDQVTGARKSFKDSVLDELAGQMTDLHTSVDKLSSCIGCHNCREACPICFCQECVFDSPILKNKPEEYVQLAGKKGAISVPTDKMLFHVTRVNHMGMSCVGCGQCESACPMGLPLTSVFALAGQRVQDIFDYVPARDVNEELPQSTYKERELEQ